MQAPSHRVPGGKTGKDNSKGSDSQGVVAQGVRHGL